MKKITCIICPLGCEMTIDRNLDVKFNKCSRGLEYAISELTNPERIITSTVIIENGLLKRLPVKTDIPIPKGKIFIIMKEINKLVVYAPIKIGEVLIKNVSNTNANIISTRVMDRK